MERGVKPHLEGGFSNKAG